MPCRSLGGARVKELETRQGWDVAEKGRHMKLMRGLSCVPALPRGNVIFPEKRQRSEMKEEEEELRREDCGPEDLCEWAQNSESGIGVCAESRDRS